MSRISPYRARTRVQIILEGKVHKRAKAKARALGLRGGVSEYVSLLIQRARRNKRS